MKIKRYQNGGISYTPFFRDAAEPTQVATQTSKTSENKEEQLIQKEIINVLKENGLPNDVDYFLDRANSFLRKSQNLGELFVSGQSNQYDMSDLIRLQSLANRIKHNNELHETASEQIIKEGSGSEVAISNEGSLYVYNKDGSIKTISADTYYKNPQKYQALTNSQLIHLREERPELAYNNSILTDLSNTVGMKSIVDYVKATIGAFGTNKSSNQFDRYTSKYQNKIEKGFEQLLGFNGPDGIYKVTESTSSSNQGYHDKESLDLAVNYLYKTLPQNMKNVLRAQAAAEGFNPSNPEDVKRLLQIAVVEHTNHSVENTQALDYDSTASKAGSGSSGGTDKDVNRSSLETIAAGRVVDPKIAVLSTSDAKGGLEIVTRDYPLQDKNGTQVTQNTLKNVLDKAEIGNIVDKNSIFFGDQRISDIDLNRIVWDGSSSLSRMWLPKDRDAEQMGIYKPDLDAYDRYTKFEEWIEDNPNVSRQRMIEKLHEYDLDLEFDTETNRWKFRPEDMMVFFGLSGYASDKAIDFDSNSPWLWHVDGPDRDRIFDIYSTYVNYGGDVVKKSDKKVDNFKPGFFGKIFHGNKNSMYKGMIFMPMHDSKLATVASNHEIGSASEYRDIYNQANLKKQQQSIKANF